MELLLDVPNITKEGQLVIDSMVESLKSQIDSTDLRNIQLRDFDYVSDWCEEVCANLSPENAYFFRSVNEHWF